MSEDLQLQITDPSSRLLTSLPACHTARCTLNLSLSYWTALLERVFRAVACCCTRGTGLGRGRHATGHGVEGGGDGREGEGRIILFDVGLGMVRDSIKI